MKFTAALLLGGASAEQANSLRDFLRTKTSSSRSNHKEEFPNAYPVLQDQFYKYDSSRQRKSRSAWYEPKVREEPAIAQVEPEALYKDDGAREGPQQFVRATVNIMRAVYTTIEEVGADMARRRLQVEPNGPAADVQPNASRKLTEILDYELAHRLQEAKQRELDDFVRVTDEAEARHKAGELKVGNAEIHQENDGRHFQLTHKSITGVSHGTFERIEKDDGGYKWVWHDLENCPQEWHILDSPDPVAEMMIFINHKSKIAILAFRGGESEITDWKTNFDAFTGKLHMTNKADEDDFMSVGGHEGYINAFNSNRGWLRHALHRHIPEDFDIVLTGHSQGGALAYIGALVITVEFGRHVSAVVPYASPKFGFQDLVELYEEKVGCDGTLHFWNNWDPAARVPFHMSRPCEDTRADQELTCEFNIWHFWKCHYADTYQREVRSLMARNEGVHWDSGCERERH